MQIKAFHDIQQLRDLIPRPVVATMLEFPGQLILAGGFLRAILTDMNIKDVDLFVTDSSIVLKVRDALVRHGLVLMSETKNSLTFRGVDLSLPIQLITRFYAPTPEELVKSFDFTICQFAAWVEDNFDGTHEWRTYAPDQAFADLTDSVLRYTMPDRDEDVGASLIRSYKFAGIGYAPDKDTIAKLVGRVTARAGISFSSDENDNSAALSGLLIKVGYPWREPRGA